MAIDRARVLKRAEDLLRQGRLDAAIAEYLRILEDQPHDVTTANIVGDLFAQCGDADRAVAHYAQIADRYRREGFLSKAAALYKKILKIKPDDETALWRAGEVAEEQGLVADAKAAYLALADERRRRGDQRGAAELLVRVASLDPADIPSQRRAIAALLEVDDRARAAAMLTNMAAVLLKRHRRHEAVEALRQAAEVEELGPEAAGPLLEAYRLFQATKAAGDAPGARTAEGGTAAQEGRSMAPADLRTAAALLASMGLDDQALRALADAEAPRAWSAPAPVVSSPPQSARGEFPTPASPAPAVAPSTPDAPRARSVRPSMEEGPGGSEGQGFEGSAVQPHVRVSEGAEAGAPGSDGAGVRGEALPADAELDLTPALDLLQESNPAVAAKDAGAEREGLDLEQLFEELHSEACGLESHELGLRELEVGLQCYRDGRVDHAARALELAVRTEAARFRAAALLGRIALERGRTREAIGWFEQACEAQPAGVGGSDDAEERCAVLYELGNTLEAAGERTQALAVFVELRMVNPRYRDVAKRVTRLRRR